MSRCGWRARIVDLLNPARRRELVLGRQRIIAIPEASRESDGWVLVVPTLA